MIYHVVTLVVKPGKMNEARPLLVDYANHVMKTYPDQEVRILTNVSGPGNRLHWVTRGKSLDGEAIKQTPENLAKIDEFEARRFDIFEDEPTHYYYRDVE